MPEDMRERTIANCKSGEAKPLILPKKRLAYLPTAVTACVCVLVVALAGAGIWQMKVLSEGSNEPTTIVIEGNNDSSATSNEDIGAATSQEDIINVIPVSDEENTIVSAYLDGYSEEQFSYDDIVGLTEEELNEYYGIDTGSLLSGLGIQPTVYTEPMDGWSSSIFRAGGGSGEVYYDTNAFTYGENEEICIYISKFGIPYSIPKLWSDSRQLSTISGITAAVGMREGREHKQYRVEFERALEHDTLYFNVWCDYDMISSIVREIKLKCDSSYVWGVPEAVDITEITEDDITNCLNIIGQNSEFTAVYSEVYDIDYDGDDEVLILADVPFRSICVFEKENGKMVQTDTFGMGDLNDVKSLALYTYSDEVEKYPYFIFHFYNGGVMNCNVVAAIKPADDSYSIEYLLSFGTLNYTDIPEPVTKEFYRIGWNKTDIAMDGDYNDISKEEFMELYEKYRVKEPLTLDKLREICSGDTSKLSWDDFEQFESTDIGSGLYILAYNIEDKYTLCIGSGNPGSEPYYMNFLVIGQYYSIDIREESLEEYLSQPIPEGDFINITPLEEDEIDYFLDADFVDGEQVYLTDEQLSIYYGIDVTAFGNIPSYMTKESYTKNNGMRCIWKRDGSTGIYYDKNTFSFSNPDRSAFIDISMGSLMNYNERLWENKKMRSRISGRDVAIGGTEAGHYVAEFPSNDHQVFFVISAYGISIEELHDVLTALVEQPDARGEDYTYPSQYIDALEMQATKENYQDPADFIFGVEKIIQGSHTVEEMYQALAEFDTEGRMYKVLLSYNGVPVTEGDIKQGMYCEVYYDNGDSWFNFTI